MKPTDLLKSALQKSAQIATPVPPDGGALPGVPKPPMSSDNSGPVVGRPPALPAGKSLEQQVAENDLPNLRVVKPGDPRPGKGPQSLDQQAAFGNTLVEPKTRLKDLVPPSPPAFAGEPSDAEVAAMSAPTSGPSPKLPAKPVVAKPPPPAAMEPDEAELAKITEAAKPTPGPGDLRGTGQGPDRTIMPEDIAKQRAYEAQKAKEVPPGPPDVNDSSIASAMAAGPGSTTPAPEPRAPKVAPAAANPTASRVGSNMNPNDEVVADNRAKADAADSEAAAKASIPPADPGVIERVSNWIQDPANRPYVLGGGGLAIAGLAYLLTRDSGEEEAPKRRRRHAVA